MHVKGLEMVSFEPRSQTNLALGYAVAPIGPRYDICEHDWDFDTTVGWDTRSTVAARSASSSASRWTHSGRTRCATSRR